MEGMARLKDSESIVKSDNKLYVVEKQHLPEFFMREALKDAFRADAAESIRDFIVSFHHTPSGRTPFLNKHLGIKV